jgi:hypothetical protein
MGNATAKKSRPRRQAQETDTVLPVMQPVTCDVTRYRYKKDNLTATIEVTGTRELKDDELKAAIIEYLEAGRNCSATHERCEDMIREAERRDTIATEKLDALIEGMGGCQAIAYRGLLFGVDSIDCHPAMPVLTLVD